LKEKTNNLPILSCYVLFTVHADNRLISCCAIINSLTPGELTGYFSGRVTHWEGLNKWHVLVV